MLATRWPKLIAVNNRMPDGRFLERMSSSDHGTIFETAAAVSSAVKAMPRAGAKPRASRGLTPAAIAVSSQGFKQAYSPIVVAGAVRAIEVVLVAATGLVLYLWHVVPVVGFARYYVIAICRDLAARDAGVPGRRHLSGTGLPRPRKAIYAPRLGVVGGVSDRHRGVVFRQGRRPVLAALARQLLCGRLAHADWHFGAPCSCWCDTGPARAGSTAAPSWSVPAAAAKL